eukprot:s963_g6.t1
MQTLAAYSDGSKPFFATVFATHCCLNAQSALQSWWHEELSGLLQVAANIGSNHRHAIGLNRSKVLLRAQALHMSTGMDANDENNEENNEDDGDEEKQAFESAQELSLEQNRSERRQRQERERDLLHQGSLEPLERLDEALVDAFTDACLLTWFESEENRKLLYDYLELQTKAVAWYKEPAQAYFGGRRREMLSLLEQPDSAEAVTKFLEEEVATAQKALYYMPDKGYYLPSLFIQRDDLQGCVDLEE